MFHAMVRYGQRLEKRQVLLGHLMEIGTELFAMAAACAYGQHLATMNGSGSDPRQPADVFCRLAKYRIENHFKAARRTSLKQERAIARKVLAGDLRWLEQGIIPTERDGE